MKKIFITTVLLFFAIFYTKVHSSEFDIKAKTVILQDYLSGKILFEKDPDLPIFPASMTKIMTSIVTFDLIEQGHLKLDEKFFVSENAWRLSQAGYSSMFIMVGDQITIDDLLKGIIISSGNDACIALAEGIAGTEEEFAIMMTSKAKEIGMKNTNFANSSGINHPKNLSTARDILIMSNYLIKNYPEFYEYFKEKEFTWDRTGGEPITQGNRNPLLYKNIGADGIKTGFLSYEKYSLAASIIKNNRRLISVGSGFESRNSRSRESQKLLTWGLTNFDTIEIAKKGIKIAELDVWLGQKDQLGVYSETDIYKTIKKARLRKLEAKIIYNGPILAPIKKDDIVAKLIVNYDGSLISEHDLLASQNINRKNIISRILKSINYLIWGDV
jgi:D-alanyl-D-alanine carboxypeptidase (penicillin-binding protein 5/6)